MWGALLRFWRVVNRYGAKQSPMVYLQGGHSQFTNTLEPRVSVGLSVSIYTADVSQLIRISLTLKRLVCNLCFHKSVYLSHTEFKIVFYGLSSFSSYICCFVTHMGQQEHQKLTQPLVPWKSPLPAILYMSPGLLEQALMGALLVRDLSSHSLHEQTCIYTSHTDVSHADTYLKWDKCDVSRSGYEECQPSTMVWHLPPSVSLSTMGNTAAQENYSQTMTLWAGCVSNVEV